MTEPLDDMIARQGAAFVAGLRKRQPRVAAEPKAKKRGTPELDQQEAVVSWLRKAGCVTSRNINELQSREKDPIKRGRFWQKLVKTGCTKGFPDVTAILPDGRTVFIEMKAGKNDLTAEQGRIHDNLRARGGIVVVGRDVWSTQAALAAAGVVIERTPRLRAAVPVEPLR